MCTWLASVVCVQCELQICVIFLLAGDNSVISEFAFTKIMFTKFLSKKFPDFKAKSDEIFEI